MFPFGLNLPSRNVGSFLSDAWINSGEKITLILAFRFPSYKNSRPDCQLYRETSPEKVEKKEVQRNHD